MAKRIQTQLVLELLENGIDFVTSGIETYFMRDTPNPRAHKYALLHMWSGTLLILKERLRRIDPALVFEGVGPNTVKFGETLKRLKENGIVITPAHLSVLWRTQKRRNEIEHYAVTLSLGEAKEIIGDLAAFIHAFCIDELQFHIEDRFKLQASQRFYDLKAVGDKMHDLLIADLEAEAKARTAWWEEMEERYGTMAPDEVRIIAAAEDGVPAEALVMLPCPRCEEPTLVIVECEVAVCTNGACGAIQEASNCRSCGGLAYFPSEWCRECSSG